MTEAEYPHKVTPRARELFEGVLSSQRDLQNERFLGQSGSDVRPHRHGRRVIVSAQMRETLDQLRPKESNDG